VCSSDLNKLKRGRLGYDPYYYYDTYYQYYTEEYHPYSMNGVNSAKGVDEANGANGHRWYNGRAIGIRAKNLVSRLSRRSRDSSE
jgi:restriction endonuclease S subunit